LTNYSVQKYNNEFSKCEIGNEISFKEFQELLNSQGANYSVKQQLYPKLKNIIKLSIMSVRYKINMRNRKYCYEVFGYDFIIDENFTPYLLEINTNPGLEDSSPLISKLVPRMIEDSLKLTLYDVFDLPLSSATVSVDGYDDNENIFDFVCKV
jgi:hypothetical protein